MGRKIKDTETNISKIYDLAEIAQDVLRGCVVRKVCEKISETNTLGIFIEFYSIEKECRIGLDIDSSGRVILAQIFKVGEEM